MKTITDDLGGFFTQGGWTFLGADSEGEGDGEGGGGGGGDNSDEAEDDYDPDEEASEEEGKKNYLWENIFDIWFLGSESEYSAEEEDDDFEEDESDSGMNIFFDQKQRINLWSLDASEKLATDEESGKSWSELEEEARKG